MKTKNLLHLKIQANTAILPSYENLISKLSGVINFSASQLATLFIRTTKQSLKQLALQTIPLLSSAIATALLITNLFFVSSSFGQETARATWALNSNFSSTVTGKVLANAMTWGAGIEGPSISSERLYTCPYNQSSLSDAMADNNYLEFIVSPSDGLNFDISSISFGRAVPVSMLNPDAFINISVLFSTDPDFVNYNEIGSAKINSPNIETTSFTVQSSLIAVGNRQTGYIRIYGWGLIERNYFCINNVVISGNTYAACDDPDVQATMQPFTATGVTGATVNWRRGDGNGVIVVGRLTSTVGVDPVNMIYYNMFYSPAHSAFGTGNSTGEGNYIVYMGTGTSVAVTNLMQATDYTFTVYEYNDLNYCNKTPGSSLSVSTLCPDPTITSFIPESVCSGRENAIIIDGANFVSGGTSVTVNGISATPVTFINSNRIAVPLPAEVSGTGNITVTTCSTVTSGSTFTVNVSPTTPTGALGADRCGTGSVTISVADPGTELTVDWYANPEGGPVLAGGSGTSSFTTPVITNTTTYYAQTRNTTTGCVSSERTAVIATTKTTPTAGTISGPSPVCFGSSGISYFATGINNATSYTWAYSGTGAIINGTTNPVTIDFASDATPGTLIVNGNNECGDGTVSANYPITFFSGPAVTGATICLGATGMTMTAECTGMVEWYTQPSGGTLVESASSFDPVGDDEVIAQGGIYANLTNTETPGTYTFFAECQTNPGCRTAVDFVILPVAEPDVTGFSIENAASPVLSGSPLTLIFNSPYIIDGTYTVIYNLTGANTSANVSASVEIVSHIGSFTTSGLINSGPTTITITSVKNASDCSSAVTSNNSKDFVVGPSTSSKNYSSGFFYVPEGIFSITVETWGGGGAGGGNRYENNGGGGGGGGAYSSSLLTVTPGTKYSVIVGEAGTGTIGGSGGDGRESYFAEYDPYVILVLANGGTGGHDASYDMGGSGGLGGVVSDKGTTKYAGGNGGKGRTSSIGRGGGGGSSAGTNANGTAGENGITGNVGGTAPDGGGDGGDGGISNTNGQSGVQPGGAGGGSGGKLSLNDPSLKGGDGANGQVKITWLCPLAAISYSSPYFYSSESPAAVTITGSTGGTFSAVPVGLSINDLTGEINPASSNAGIYTIHYQIPAAGDCAPVDATAEVTIITPPTGPASVTYCASEEKTVDDLTSLMTGTDIKWYSSATGGSQFTGTELLVARSYFASQTVGGIESVERAEVAVTVNPRPATPTITTNIPPIICQGGAVILTSSAGTSYLWSTGATNQSISVGTTGDYTVQVIDALGCMSLPSSPQHVDADHDIPAAAVSPNPANGATNMCYSGEGAVSSLSWASVPEATSYDVYLGDGSLPTEVTQNVTTNSYTVTLSANKTYYWKVVSKNNCGTAASAATWTFTTQNAPCYCTPSSPYHEGGLSWVKFNTIDRDALYNSDYVDLTNFAQTSVIRGSIYYLTVEADTDPMECCWSQYYQQAWIDWNQDGIFSQESEVYVLGEAINYGGEDKWPYKKSSLCPLAITVPANAPLGKTRMRVSSSSLEYATACGPIRVDGTYLDFGINVLPCDPAVFTAHPSTTAQEVCVGGTINTLSVMATGTALTYKWYKNNTASNTGGTVITGANSTSYTPLSTSSGTFYYYCIASGQCSQPTPSNVSGAITVTAPPVAGPIIGDQVLYLGYTRKLTLSEAADEGGTWTSSNTDIVSVDASSGLVTGISLGTATISYTVTGLGGCDNAKTEFQVTVSESTYSCFGASDAVYGYNDPNGDMSPENAVGYPDNNYAAIGQNEYIALDLTGGNLSLGSTVTVTWSKWAGETFPPDAYLYESQDGVNWQFIKHDNIYHTSFTEYSIPVNISTRYLKIENRTAYWLYIKSVTYNYPCSGCLNGTLALTTDNKDQIICPNSAISDIIYSVGGGATGATVSGLPNGMIGTYSNESVIISGSTSVIGTFNYTVATTGIQSGCTNVTLNGAITILSEVPDANFASTSSNCPVCSGDNAEFYLTGTANATVAFSLDGGTTTETASLDGSGQATVIVPGVTENQEMSLISVYVGSCTKTLFGSATVIVKPLPVVSILSNTLMEVGGTTTLSPASGGTWTSSNNAVAAVTPAGVVTGISVGTATFTFTDAETGCSATTAKVTVTTNVCAGYAVDYFEEFGIVESSYFAIKNPDGQVASISYESNLILDLTGGNNVVFSPLALTMFVSEGDNPYVRISESSDRMNWTPVYSGNISNAEPLNYSLTVSEDARYIQIENTISNPEVWVYIDGVSYNYPCAGCMPPSITGQPSTAIQTLCMDGTATALSVTATGTDLTYQWYSNASASNTGGSPIEGATSASYIPLTTTAGTLYYYCEVSNACPPSAKSNVSGAVTVNPYPVITNPGNQVACVSYILPTINGSNLVAAKYYNNSQALAGTVITGPITSSQTVWIYDATGTTPNCSDEESFTVTINPKPTLSGVTASAWGVCLGGSVDFTASGLLDGFTTFNYTLTFDGIDETPNVVNNVSVSKEVTGGVAKFTIDAPALGTYFFEINSATLNGCTTNFGTINNHDYFAAEPQPSVVLVATDNITTICSGTETVLTAYPNGGVGKNHISIQKLVAGDWIEILESEEYYSIMVSPTETTTYRAVYSMDGNGCNDAISDELTITVNPVPSCSIAGEDGPVCVLRSLDYSAPEGMTAYKWAVTGNARIISSDEIRTITVRTGELDLPCGTPFTITLTVTDANGCTSTCTKTVAGATTQPVDVTGPASVSYKTCEFASQEALNTVYQAWENQFRVVQAGCGGNTTDLNLFYPPDIITGHTNVIDYTLSDGCTSDTHRAIFTVEPVTAPAINQITATTNPICSDGQTTLVAQGVGGTDVTLTWFTGSNGTGTNLGTGSSKTVTGPGTYYARVTGYCNPAEASITIDEIPQSAVGPLTGTSPLCVGATATYTPNGVVLGKGTVKWLSSDETVATVSPDGLVTAIGRGTADITYVIENGCNGNVSAIKTVTVNSAPTFTLQPENKLNVCAGGGTSATFNATATGAGPISYAWFKVGGNPNGTDKAVSNGGPEFNTLIISPVNLADVGSYYVNVSNDCGTAKSDVVQLTIESTPPQITCPENIIINNDAGVCSAVVTYIAPVGTDNCLNPVTTQIAGLPSGSTFPVGVTTNSFKVTDEAGLTATCDFTVTVVDNQAPVIICPADLPNVTADQGKCYATVTVNRPVITDICDINIIPVSNTTELVINGNFSDGISKWRDCPNNAEVKPEHYYIVPEPAPSSNNVAEIDHYVSLCQNISGFTVGKQYVVTFIASRRQNDGTPNPVSVNVNIDGGALNTVVTRDNTIFKLTRESFIFTASSTTHKLTITPGTNNISSLGFIIDDISIKESNIVETYPVGTTTLIWTAADTHGNTATCEQKITVTDNEAPVITNEDDITQTADAGLCSADIVVTAPLATDNCGIQGSVAGTRSDLPLTIADPFPVGITTITWTVSDIHGNPAAPVTQLVSVTDNEKPVITCAADQAKTADPSKCYATVAVVPPTVTDNCDNNIFPVSNTELIKNGNFNKGISNWQDCGNTAEVNTEEFYIVPLPPKSSNYVSEVDKEVSLCQTISGFTPGEKYVLTFKASRRQNSGTPNPVSVNVVIDGSVLSKVVKRTNTIFNLTSESFEFTATQATHKLTFTPSADNIYSLGLVVDDISIRSISYPVGTTTLVWTATDIYGNTAACEQIITVTDDELPTITCPVTEASYSTDAGKCTKSLTFDATASDNCGIVEASREYFIGNVKIIFPYDFPFGTTTVTAKVSDIHGNPNQCDFVVVIDKITTNTAVTVVPNPQEYSDRATFTATVEPGFCGENTLKGTLVLFKVGNQELPPAVPVTLIDGVWKATAERALLENPSSPSNGVMAPGDHTVTAVFQNEPEIFIVNDPTASLTIDCEDDVSVTTDNSETYFTANPTSGKGDVWFRAYVEETDDSFGNVANANIQFMNELSNPPSAINPVPALVNPIPGEQRAVSVYTLSGYQLNNSEMTTTGGHAWLVRSQTGIGSYYCGNDEGEPVVFVLAMPGGDFVTGGGKYIHTRSAGVFAATAGTSLNFGFNMKWNKSGKNLQGNINVVFRTGTKIYHIKSNAINALAVSQTTQGSLVYNSGIMTTKANLTDITDPLNPVSTPYGGNLNLKVVVWDATSVNGGSADKITVELTASDNTTLIYSSFASGIHLADVIKGGNINVRNTNGIYVPPTCGAPTNVLAANLTQTSAQITWDAVSTTNTYDIWYKLSSDIGFLQSANDFTTTNIYLLEGLQAGKTYDVKVGRNCSDGYYESSVLTFTTTTDGTTSCTVYGLTALTDNTNKVTLRWSALNTEVSSLPVSYKVEYKKSTATTWTTVNSTVPNLVLTLATSTKYNWRVTPSCGTSSTNGLDFTTGATKTKAAEIATGFVPEFEFADLKVYPNPFSEKLYFEFTSPVDNHVLIQVFDVTGRLINTVFDNPVKADIIYNTEFKPASLVTSMYFYRMTLGEKVFVGKVIYKK